VFNEAAVESLRPGYIPASERTPQMNLRHTVLWIDHQEARIFGVEAGKLDESTIHAPHLHLHRHPKGAPAEHNHPEDLHHFFRDVARALDGAEQILIVGPSTAKVEFFRFVHRQDPALEPNVVGIETVDHPTDGQLVAYAKRYFGVPPVRVQ
jgi:stalled ribosome rescue protein Dom34